MTFTVIWKFSASQEVTRLERPRTIPPSAAAAASTWPCAGRRATWANREIPAFGSGTRTFSACSTASTKPRCASKFSSPARRAAADRRYNLPHVLSREMSMPEPLGFAIVGCGMIARFHVAAPSPRSPARASRRSSAAPTTAPRSSSKKPKTPPCPVFAHGRGGREGARRGRGHHHHAQRGAPRARARRRGRRQARRRREAARNHRPAVPAHHRRLRPRKVQALHHLPVAVRRLERHAQGRGRRRQVRPAHARRNHQQVVAHADSTTTRAAGRARRRSTAAARS